MSHSKRVNDMPPPTVPIISIEGRYFYQGENRFIARGVVYQPANVLGGPRVGNPDALDDTNYSQVLHDIELFKDLRINALWVYRHNAEAKHDKCMQALADNGIYVIFETANPKFSVNRIYPIISYTSELLDNFSKVIDSVARYHNTLGVCLANQVVNQVNYNKYQNADEVWDVLGHIVRDVKQYMRYKHFDKGQRILPLCITDGQWASLNTSTFQYLTDLGPGDGPVRPANGRVDFYCFIHYDAVEDASVAPYSRPRARKAEAEEIIPVHPNALDVSVTSTIERPSSWAEQLPMKKFLEAEDPVPILVSEYGSTATRPRKFDEIAQLYGDNMSGPLLNTLSGGFAYEFEEGVNRYGMIVRQADGSLRRLSDYFNFRDHLRVAVGE